MLDFILCRLGVSLEEFISGETELIKDEAEVALKELTDVVLSPIWKHGTGLCTSFAVYLTSKMDTPSHFIYGNYLGRHRASYSRSGIIIDSSARNLLHDAHGGTLKAYGGKWRLKEIETSQPVLSFKVSSSTTLTIVNVSNVQQPKKSSRWATFEPLPSSAAALKCCLLQLCDQKNFLCMFR